jgi:hypothetical protein
MVSPFNLRHYMKGLGRDLPPPADPHQGAAGYSMAAAMAEVAQILAEDLIPAVDRMFQRQLPLRDEIRALLEDEVGWCKLKCVETCVETACFQRLKLQCEKLFSSFGVNEVMLLAPVETGAALGPLCAPTRR